MDVRYKLYSNDARGRTELIRLIFHAAGKPFEDIRVHHTLWDQLKWGTPWRMLPVLEFDRWQLAQSRSIARYLAGIFDLTGRTNLERAFVDEAVEMIDEILTDALKIQYENNSRYQKHILNKFLSRTLPFKLRKLDTFKANHSSGFGYIFGKDLTYADLAAYSTFDQIVAASIAPWSTLEAFTYPRQLRKEIFDGELRISEYLKNRDPMMRPY